MLEKREPVLTLKFKFNNTVCLKVGSIFNLFFITILQYKIVKINFFINIWNFLEGI